MFVVSKGLEVFFCGNVVPSAVLGSPSVAVAVYKWLLNAKPLRRELRFNDFFF